MKCDFCRNDVDEDSSICSNCGAPISTKKEKVVEAAKEVIESVNITNIDNNTTNNEMPKKTNKAELLIFISIIVIITLLLCFIILNK